MNNSFKYILVTAILFNIAMTGCVVQQNETESEDNGSSVSDDKGGDRDEDDNDDDDKDDRNTPTQSSNTTTAPSATSSDVRVIYKDGSFTGNSTYTAPSGKESVGVTVTVKNNVIESLKLDLASDNEVSQKYKAMFAEGINELVIGKPLNEIGGFKVVNGSSLTPIAFNNAVEQIKLAAKN